MYQLLGLFFFIAEKKACFPTVFKEYAGFNKTGVGLCAFKSFSFFKRPQNV